MDTRDPADNPSPPSARGRRRIGRRLLLALVLLAAATGAIVAFLATDTALGLVLHIAVARSEGHLSIEEPAGSLLSTVRAKRIGWHGPDATMTADGVAFTWSPAALFSRGIVVNSVSAQRLALNVRVSDAATPLPASLALPTHVAIDRVTVDRFVWTVGTSHGAIAGLAFGYEGDAHRHQLRHLVLTTDQGTVGGEAALAALAPYTITGALMFTGNAALSDAVAQLSLAGTLAHVVVDGHGSVGEARGTLQARLAPLAAVVLEEVDLEARDVDLARWDEALPATRLSVKAEARPAGDGLEGHVEAENALAGPVDQRRVPLRSARARFVWSARTLTLDDLDAALAGRGNATGRARIPLDGGAGTWTITVADVDLKQIYAPLAATRLSGSIVADLDADRQRIDGDIADRTVAGGISLRFAAAIGDGRLDLASFRARAGAGELAGSGGMELAGARAFRVKATSTRLDPAHFGNFPAGSLDGEITASGVLRPAWRVDAEVRLAAGSKLAGVPASGAARASLASLVARDVVADLKLGATSLSVRGGAGETDSLLKVVFDSPKLAELAHLMPAQAPQPIAGALSATAELRGRYPDGGVAIDAKGKALKVGSAYSLATLAARITVEPVMTARAPAAFIDRVATLDVTATEFVTPQGRLARAHAGLEGTFGRHEATIALAGEDFDVNARLRGGFDPARAAAGFAGWHWIGTLDALENRGAWPLRLTAPVALDLEREHVKIGAAAVAVADGRVDIEMLAWDAGRVTTRGLYSGVPVATLARLAGIRLPVKSTLTLAGDWALAATPRLNGSVTLRREQGDLYLDDDTPVAAAERMLGIVALDIGARFQDDAIDATGAVRTDRGAILDARLAIAAVPNTPPGRIAADAPLSFTLTAELATLRLIQPWVGTTAVIDGAARLELAGAGTVGQPTFTGMLRGTGLRFDAADIGLHFSDGRLAATLADGVVRLDELAFAGGAGRFTASGTLVNAKQARGDREGARARITWQAERFRALHRPDRRVIVTGAGTLAVVERQLAVTGKLRADEGHFDYAPTARVTLGDDVVVKGWPPRTTARNRNAGGPLTLDVELDLGEKLTFSGEGLRTGLRGSLALTTAPDGSLRGRGSITAENGTYYAFGQRLTIDRGRLIFVGPLDNPGLDIVALRKNLAVEAGVEVTGTVQVPIIRLTSNPPVPDNEKLSWLVLGRGLDRTSGGDVAALQAASAALLGRNSRPITSTFAESIGIDDISFQSATGVQRGAGGTETSGQAVTFGKRLTDRLSLVYEQGLSVASNALRLEYALTQSLTLRADAGVISGFGIYYRRTFE